MGNAVDGTECRYKSHIKLISAIWFLTRQKSVILDGTSIQYQINENVFRIAGDRRYYANKRNILEIEFGGGWGRGH